MKKFPIQAVIATSFIFLVGAACAQAPGLQNNPAVNRAAGVTNNLNTPAAENGPAISGSLRVNTPHANMAVGTSFELQGQSAVGPVYARVKDKNGAEVFTKTIELDNNQKFNQRIDLNITNNNTIILEVFQKDTSGAETNMVSVPLLISETASSEVKLTDKQLTLRQSMRQLWSDHVIWTRLYIMAAVAKGGDKGPAVTRLLKNQEDIGNAMKPYYGDAAGDSLTTLLKSHITIAVDIIDDAIAGNTAKQATDEAAWAKNADDVAVFLSKANPNWTQADLTAMLNQHLALTKTELVDRLTKKYSEEPAAFDAVYDEMMTMSDMLSLGMIKQFPEKF